MIVKTPYKHRIIRFIELIYFDEWTIKCYTITQSEDHIAPKIVMAIKNQLSAWIQHSERTNLTHYNTATLIIHQGKEGYYAIIAWWIDENMLQLFAYFSPDPVVRTFQMISDKGIVSCVWEMAILWFERNAWVEEVMLQNNNPYAKINYLNRQLNTTL
ncbi:MAG TPA: hypothetical protein PLO56_14210 [Rhodothermales bacterium]|nr:hypothetical protein [Rhodothermales bacterium]